MYIRLPSHYMIAPLEARSKHLNLTKYPRALAHRDHGGVWSGGSREVKSRKPQELELHWMGMYCAYGAGRVNIPPINLPLVTHNRQMNTIPKVDAWHPSQSYLGLCEKESEFPVVRTGVVSCAWRIFHFLLFRPHGNFCVKGEEPSSRKAQNRKS